MAPQIQASEDTVGAVRVEVDQVEVDQVEVDQVEVEQVEVDQVEVEQVRARLAEEAGLRKRIQSQLLQNTQDLERAQQDLERAQKQLANTRSAAAKKVLTPRPFRSNTGARTFSCVQRTHTHTL